MSPARRRTTLAILALAVGGFAIGTTEFVTMGLLPQIAEGTGVDIATAGHYVSAYAARRRRRGPAHRRRRGQGARARACSWA